MSYVKIGVIGGSGLYDIKGLTDVEEVKIDTPFGKPSDIITIGQLEKVKVAFLPRHGKGHQISPTEVPYQANIFALKLLGAEWIIAVNAVGSLKAEMKPGDLVIPDQLIDRTQSRINSFFHDGIVGHILFADPFCSVLRSILYRSARQVDTTIHKNGTYVVMEGPAFSTRAESRLHRSWGASLIGMTALPEAKLAREAEMCYAIVAGITDFDCWQDDTPPTTIDDIITTLKQNTDNMRSIIKSAITSIPDIRECDCVNALRVAIATDPKMIPARQRKKLDPLISKYITDGET